MIVGFALTHTISIKLSSKKFDSRIPLFQIIRRFWQVVCHPDYVGRKEDALLYILYVEREGLGCMFKWESSSNFIPYIPQTRALSIWFSVEILFWESLVTRFLFFWSVMIMILVKEKKSHYKIGPQGQECKSIIAHKQHLHNMGLQRKNSINPLV